MPAIQLNRLKIQTGRLADSFLQPAIFLRQLQDLYDFYADRTHRPGQAGKPSSLLASYNVPLPVQRHIQREIAPLVRRHPQQALMLMDQLWEREQIEYRQLAIEIFAILPVSLHASLFERLQVWIHCKEEQLLDQLLDQGLALIRTEATVSLIEQVRSWLMSEDMDAKQAGIRCLTPLVREPSFDNLPLVIRLITPFVRRSMPRIRPDVHRLLIALSQRSPRETAYFLISNLSFSDTAWYTRQVMQHLPPELQENVRAEIRKTAQETTS